MKPIYQWILQDHQEMSFNRFEITSTYHATEADLLSYYPYLRECRSIVGKYTPSKISTAWLIQAVTEIQNNNKKRDNHER